jgi:hypothetical protein
MSRKLLTRGVLVLALLGPGCATRQPGDPLRPGYNVYSPDQDVQLGREAAAEIRKQVEVVPNERLQNYVSTLGKKLAAQPPAGEYPYEFTVINDPAINAFALPGGPIFVHSGLIAAADNEGQVAGVLAHEISHVALRHATSQASKANMIQLPAVLAGVAIGDQSVLAQLGQLGLGLGVNALMMKYSRGAENEADALGARIMAEAGYDPVQMARFFEKLEAEGGARAPTFLSSHPSPGNRVQNVQAELAALPPRQYNAGDGQFAPMKQVVAQLPPPRRAQQQVANANQPAPSAAPPSAFEPLQTDRYAIAYPRGWRTYGDQRSAAVTIAPQQGLVRSSSGGVAIGYGVVLSYYQPQSRNLAGATNELVGQLQSLDRNLRVSGQQRRVRVGGSDGIVTYLSGSSPYGGQETDVVLTVARPEGLFYMVFVAPSRDFSQLEGAFQKMLDSIQFRRA